MAINFPDSPSLNDTYSFSNKTWTWNGTSWVLNVDSKTNDNLIINGNFDIWQRGASFSDFANGTYTADRWVAYQNGTGASRTVSRQAFTLGQTDVPNEPEYFFRYDQSVAGSGATFCNIEHRIEGVRTLAGQTATLSFWAKCSSLYNMTAGVAQKFGTGGSPSSSTATGFGTASLTTSWAKYTFTTTVPSISGKTLGTNNNDNLNLYFQLPLNTTFTIDIAQIKLEPGDTATDFVPRRIEDELAKCQRYYQVAISTLGFIAASAGEQQQHNGTMFTQMRATPTLTVLSVEISVNATRILVADGPNGWRHVLNAITAGQCGDYVLTVSLDSEL